MVTWNKKGFMNFNNMSSRLYITSNIHSCTCNFDIHSANNITKNITINYFPFLRVNFYLKESIIKEYAYDSTNGGGGYDDIDRLGANAAYNVFIELKKLKTANWELDNYFIERIIDKFTDNLWALVEIGSEESGGLGLNREKYQKDIENGLYNN